MVKEPPVNKELLELKVLLVVKVPQEVKEQQVAKVPQEVKEPQVVKELLELKVQQEVKELLVEVDLRVVMLRHIKHHK